MKSNDATRASAEVAPAAVAECPYNKIRRLSRDLAEALDNVEHYDLAMIYPASRHAYPISWCMDREYARQSYAMLRYRDAVRALSESTGKTAEREAARDDAHNELVASFIEAAVKGGAA